MSTLALAVLAAVAALTGVLTALLVDAMNRYDAGVDAQVQAERAQRHQAGIHVRRGGRGPCLVCGDKGGQ